MIHCSTENSVIYERSYAYAEAKRLLMELQWLRHKVFKGRSVASNTDYIYIYIYMHIYFIKECCANFKPVSLVTILST